MALEGGFRPRRRVDAKNRPHAAWRPWLQERAGDPAPGRTARHKPVGLCQLDEAPAALKLAPQLLGRVDASTSWRSRHVLTS